jgi:hypothetical protein
LKNDGWHFNIFGGENVLCIQICSTLLSNNFYIIIKETYKNGLRSQFIDGQ